MKNIFLISIITVLVACSPSSTQNETPTQEHNNSIKLNNGNRWIVNEEMKPFIENGITVLTTYISTNDTNFTQLAEELKNQNSKLISSCTMKGESHEELHKWLHPHLDLVKKLSQSANKKEADLIVKELEKSYQLYTQYFK